MKTFIEKLNKTNIEEIRAEELNIFFIKSLFIYFDREDLKDAIERRYLDNKLNSLIYDFLDENLINIDEYNNFKDEFLYDFEEFKDFITEEENVNEFFNRVEDLLK